MEKYDAVVIGSGIGGLLCAAFLAQKGRRVAVFEKENHAGGFCSSFTRDGYVFDVAIDSLGGLREGGLLKNILERLDIETKLDFIELQPVRRNIFPDFSIDIPSDVALYKEELKKIFHTEKENLDKMFALMEEIYEGSMVSILNDERGGRFKWRSWMGKSFQSLLDGYLNDSRLKAVFSSYCTFLGLPASQVSAIAAINTLMHYVKGGAFKIRGGVQKLADALVEFIINNSGKVFLKEVIKNVLTKEGKAVGIIAERQGCVLADFIISNMDLKTLVNSMVEKDVVDKDKVLRLNELEISGSFVIVYLGIDMDLRGYDLASSMGYFSSYCTDAMLNKNKDISFGMSIPSICDDSLVPEKKHSLIIHWPLSERNRSVNKNEIADILIKQAENIIPDLSKHIALRLVADAKTLYRYTGNSGGAAYGWKQRAGFYSNLPLFRNILDNFFVVGHWAGFGGGIVPSAISALKTVEKITKEKIEIP